MDTKPVGYLPTAGFTLVEMAIVLLLMGIVMTMGLKIVTATLNNSAYSDTKAKQERIKVALIGFLRTNGRLPCPDNAAGIATGGAAASCEGTTQDGYGVIPWRTLGIPRDTVQDGWGNYFSYRVANGIAPAIKNWASKTAGNAFDIDQLTTQSVALTIQEYNATETGYDDITNKAVAVIISHGNNGFGAKTVKVAARMPTAGAGADEITNASNTTPRFIRRPVTDVATAVGEAYDDLVAYMTPQDLLQPLLDEKTIKVCKSYCFPATSPGYCPSSPLNFCFPPSPPFYPSVRANQNAHVLKASHCRNQEPP